MKRALVHLTGGLDSTVLLAYVLSKQDREIRCASFEEGENRRSATEKVAKHYKVELIWEPFPYYENGRNFLIWTEAAVMAKQIRDCNEIWTSVSSCDFKDAQPTVVDFMRNALVYGMGVQLFAPFMHQSKDNIISTGYALDVPFHLTRTCMQNGEHACGVCDPCRNRLMGFARLKKQDPIIYSQGKK